MGYSSGSRPAATVMPMCGRINVELWPDGTWLPAASTWAGRWAPPTRPHSHLDWGPGRGNAQAAGLTLMVSHFDSMAPPFCVTIMRIFCFPVTVRNTRMPQLPPAETSRLALIVTRF